MSISNLKDLHSLLRPRLGDKLIIEKCEIKDLLPPGENYGSKIISINAIIRRNKKSNSENLWLVAKLPPLTQVQRDMFDSPYTFKKESFMYEEILPAYRQLELNNGVSETEVCNLGAIFFGSRLSLDPSSDFDDDAAILLENLKIKNYYTVDRMYGFDLAHAKMAIVASAKFHALGIAAKEKNPEFFEVIKKRSKCLDIKNIDAWKKMVDLRLKEISSDPIMSKHYDLCKKTADRNDFSSWTMVPVEPWSTIIHADFWTNNIMFQKDKGTGELKDIKFVDFQNYLFLSPTRELAFLTATGFNHDVMMNNFDELIELYYKTLIEKLQQLKCDTRPYTRDTFNKKLKEDAFIEFTHIICMLKVITMNVDPSMTKESDVVNLLENDEINNFRLARTRDFIHVFHAHGWLEKP